MMNGALPKTSVVEFPGLKKTRRYGAKVRTGCLTCKRRRVKCDEAKPSCSRCINSGWECGGYAQDGQMTLSGSHYPNTCGLHIKPPPSLLKCSEVDIQYLEFYYHCAGQTISSKMDNAFWSQTVLQMAHAEPSIYHALIALGYLNRNEMGSSKHTRSSLIAGAENQTLIFHYNKAIRHLVERMNETSYTLEIGLVACLLFTCIEFLRGNFTTACKHLKSGLQIISARDQGSLNSTSSNQTPNHSISIIKDDLTPIFNRTLTAALLHFGLSPTYCVKVAVPCPHLEPGHSFLNVQEAQSFSMKLHNASVSWGQKVLTQGRVTEEDRAMQQQLMQMHDAWFRALQYLEQHGILTEPDRLIANSLKSRYHTMYIALVTAREITETRYDPHLARFQALIHHTKIIIDSTTTTDTSHSIPGATEPRDSASNSAAAEQEPSTYLLQRTLPVNFTFEISLIPPLYFAATRCRCPSTRRQAISLLSQNIPREALWDAKQAATIAKRVIEIEERDIDLHTGLPTESSRVNATVDGGMDESRGFWVVFTRSNAEQWKEWLVA